MFFSYYSLITLNQGSRKQQHRPRLCKLIVLVLLKIFNENVKVIIYFLLFKQNKMQNAPRVKSFFFQTSHRINDVTIYRFIEKKTHDAVKNLFQKIQKCDSQKVLSLLPITEQTVGGTANAKRECVHTHMDERENVFPARQKGTTTKDICQQKLTVFL